MKTKSTLLAFATLSLLTTACFDGGIGSGGERTSGAPLNAGNSLTGTPVALQEIWILGSPLLLVSNEAPGAIQIQFQKETPGVNGTETQIEALSNEIPISSKEATVYAANGFYSQLGAGQLLRLQFMSDLRGAGHFAPASAPPSSWDNIQIRDLGASSSASSTHNSAPNIATPNQSFRVEFETSDNVVWVDVLKTPHPALDATLPLLTPSQAHAFNSTLTSRTDSIRIQPTQAGPLSYSVDVRAASTGQNHLEQIQLRICMEASGQTCRHETTIQRAFMIEEQN